MILPIGHEEGGVRRLPWVTFVIVALCVLAFLYTKPSFSSTGGGFEEFQDVLDYYLEHPYLELPPAFQNALDNGADQKFLEAAREMNQPPGDRELLDSQQTELDHRIEVALEAAGIGTFFRLGLVPASPTALTLLTHMFLHGGWLHLLGNLLILYLAGPFIEDVWGRPIFIGFYLAAGGFAALAHILKNPDSMVPMVGASGAIAGIMGAFLVRYWHTRIRFFYIFGIFVRGTFEAPAWLMLPLWFVGQIFFGALFDSMGSSGGGVAYWAHVGGFLFGAGGAYAIRHFRVEERFVQSSIEAKVNRTVVENADVERALRLGAQGSTDEAFSALTRLVEENPAHADAVLALWAISVEQDRPEQATGAMVRLVEAELRAGEIGLALTHWTELVHRVTSPPAGAELLVRLSQALVREGRRPEAVVTLRRAMLEAGSGMTSSMALRIARVARELDPQVARGAARLVLTQPSIDPADRMHAEKLLAELEERARGIAIS